MEPLATLFAMSFAAGWFRLRWAEALGFMATGRLARYIAVASLA
jgi:membrane protein YqaA with SNARE-associated domain